MLEVSVRKAFGARNPAADSDGSAFALDPSLDITFAAPAGFTIVFGASGAGKTTLLDCIAGVARPDAGRIAVGETVLFDGPKRIDRPVAERKLGYVFQDLALFPHLTAAENIAYGLASLERSERESRIDGFLNSFRIGHLRDRKPKDISGGERQRVALARALVTHPRVLLLDEPLAALDLPAKALMIDDLRRWNEEHRVPVLYVTHSREEVFALGENVLFLEHGRLVAQGTPHAVMSAPRLETVAQLAGFENIFDATVDAVHEHRGSMTCRLTSPANPSGSLSLETPLVRATVGARLRIGIRAGDILLATREPSEISARNIFPGTVVSLDQRDVIVLATIQSAADPSLRISVQLTLAARDSLRLTQGREVWLVIKTHSCHLMAA